MHTGYRAGTDAAVLCSGRCAVQTWMYNSESDVQGPMCNEQCTMQMCSAEATVHSNTAQGGVTEQLGQRPRAAGGHVGGTVLRLMDSTEAYVQTQMYVSQADDRLGNGAGSPEAAAALAPEQQTDHSAEGADGASYYCRPFNKCLDPTTMVS
jgi:hypothetical protein